MNTRAVSLVLAALLVAAPLALAAGGAGVVGTWDLVATTPQGELPSVLTMKMVDGLPKAEFELEGTKHTVSGEKLEGKVLTMKVEYEGAVYDVELKIDGDTMTGTWQGNGSSGGLKAKRRQ
jgi:hypothetical protein